MLINGIFTTFSGIDSLYLASFLAATIPVNTAVPSFVESTSDFVALWGSVLLAIGIASFIVAYGLFYGRNWAWSGAMALSVIGIVIPIMNIIVGYWPSIFTLILSLIVIYYLTRAEVRLYFGRRVSAPSDAAAA
jgi:hypothetical protein